LLILITEDGIVSRLKILLVLNFYKENREKDQKGKRQSTPIYRCFAM